MQELSLEYQTIAMAWAGYEGIATLLRFDRVVPVVVAGFQQFHPAGKLHNAVRAAVIGLASTSATCATESSLSRAAAAPAYPSAEYDVVELDLGWCCHLGHARSDV